MEQQLKVTIPVECPECHADSALLQLLTSYGSYCRCETCGHVWHHDRPTKEDRGTTNAA